MIFGDRTTSDIPHVSSSDYWDVTILSFTNTNQQQQFAYYIKPKRILSLLASPPSSFLASSSLSTTKNNNNNNKKTLWVLFGGNGSHCCYWETFLHKFYVQCALENDQEEQTAEFLLVEYPAKGQTNPDSPRSIESYDDQAKKAFTAFLNEKQLTMNTVIQGFNVCVLGHSLGCAVALRWIRHMCEQTFPISRILLLAPFASIAKMAEYYFYFISESYVNLVLHYPFDNLETLKNIWQLTRYQQNPKSPLYNMTIIHGICDGVIPWQMGSELARSIRDYQAYDVIDYQTLPTKGHNDILLSNAIFSGMTRKNKM